MNETKREILKKIRVDELKNFDLILDENGLIDSSSTLIYFAQEIAKLKEAINTGE